MLAIVVPTVDESTGLATARAARSALSPFADISAVRVVVDGAGSESVSCTDDELDVVRLPDLVGSYRARNIGALGLDSPHLAFIDAGVTLLVDEGFSVDPAHLISGRVIFDRMPSNAYELWYSTNAFNMRRFSRTFNFLPTITLFTSRRVFDAVGGFDERLVSGGDVDYCQRARQLAVPRISPHLTVVTGLRSRLELEKKIERQVYGQMHQARIRASSDAVYRRYVLKRLAINVLGLSGKLLPVEDPLRNLIPYHVVNRLICWRKAKILLKGLGLSERALHARVRTANAEEINACA